MCLRQASEHMAVELVTNIEQFGLLQPEWRELDASVAVPLPFGTSDWVHCWWRHLSSNRAAVRDRMFTLAVRDASHRLIGVAPMMITERPGAGPLRMRCLQFIGTDPNITEICGVGARSGYEEVVYREILTYVRRSHLLWDWMQWTGIHRAGAAVVQPDVAAWKGETCCWVLPLAPSWDEFKTRLSRNMKEALRKSINAPKRDGVELRLEVVTRQDDVGPALDRFFVLHASRAKLNETIRHPDVFRLPAARDFLRDVCKRFARRGIAHLFNLKHGATTVATRIGFRLGSSMYLYFSGYDPEYGRYSAMTRCLAGAICWSIDAGLKTVNLSTGTDISKTRWRPQQHAFLEATLITPTFRARAAHAVYTCSEQLAATSARILLMQFARRPA